MEVEALSSVVDDLRDAYEADRLEADERTRLIVSMISDSEKDEELIDAKIDAAKDADDEELKDELEDLLDLYELRRDYLERIGKLRERERQLAEARIDYVGQMAEVLNLAKDLLTAREAADQTDLLATERELIRQSHQLGERLDAVAGNLKRVNSERQKAFEEREELISANN